MAITLHRLHGLILTDVIDLIPWQYYYWYPGPGKLSRFWNQFWFSKQNQ